MVKWGTAGNLFDWKYWNKVWLGFIWFKRDLLYWNCWNKVRFGSYFIGKSKIRHSWDLFYRKRQNEVRLKIYFIEKVKITYGLGIIHWKGLRFILLKTKKIRYGCGFISLKMLNSCFTAEGLSHSKCWDKVWLWIYSNGKSQNKAQLGIHSASYFSIFNNIRPQSYLILVF